MTPAAAVSGIYLAHPQARYFAVGRIGNDQLEDYAARKGEPVAEVERWLRPNLLAEPSRLAPPGRLSSSSRRLRAPLRSYEDDTEERRRTRRRSRTATGIPCSRRDRSAPITPYRQPPPPGRIGPRPAPPDPGRDAFSWSSRSRSAVGGGAYLWFHQSVNAVHGPFESSVKAGPEGARRSRCPDASRRSRSSSATTSARGRSSRRSRARTR